MKVIKNPQSHEIEFPSQSHLAVWNVFEEKSHSIDEPPRKKGAIFAYASCQSIKYLIERKKGPI